MRINAHLLLSLIVVITSGCLVGGNRVKPPHKEAQRIVQPNGNVQPGVAEIMHILGCEHVPLRVDEFVKELAGQFTRKRGMERWHVTSEYTPEVAQKVLQQFDQLGFFKEIEPTSRSYDYLVVLGATLSRVRTRIAYLKELWERGVRGKKVIFLSGDRPLEPFEGLDQLNDREQTALPIKKEWQEAIQPLPNEAAMMKAVWEQAVLPPELAALPLEVIDTPQQTWPDGTKQRPNTGDTVIHWMKTKPQPGSCLFISNQPYVGYQGAVLHRWMPASFTVETVGSASSPAKASSVGVLVDSLLRWLAFEAFHCGLWDEKTLEVYLKQ